MRVNSGIKSLRRVPLFKTLADSELDEIEKLCSWRSYHAGEEILAYLDSGDDVYFIIAGKGKVIIYSAQGRAVGFRDIVPGDIFGEYAAIDGGSRSASIEADAACTVAIMSSHDFNSLISTNPSVSRMLIQHLTRQLRAMTQRVFEFSTLAVNNRIQAELLRLAREGATDGSSPEGTRYITPRPTHAEIAARVSTHREAVTRHLSKLTKTGLIERKGRSLIVKDVERLDRMVRNATGE
ncbi:MAG: Crp/Fnr family transcriptional regulator [Hyphomicrobiaceae bacterium]